MSKDEIKKIVHTCNNCYDDFFVGGKKIKGKWYCECCVKYNNIP